MTWSPQDYEEIESASPVACGGGEPVGYYVRMYVCMYVYVKVCASYIYMCMYVYIYIRCIHMCVLASNPYSPQAMNALNL